MLPSRTQHGGKSRTVGPTCRQIKARRMVFSPHTLLAAGIFCGLDVLQNFGYFFQRILCSGSVALTLKQLASESEPSGDCPRVNFLREFPTHSSTQSAYCRIKLDRVLRCRATCWTLRTHLECSMTAA